jgi:hypothetical protein
MEVVTKEQVRSALEGCAERDHQREWIEYRNKVEAVAATNAKRDDVGHLQRALTTAKLIEAPCRAAVTPSMVDDVHSAIEAVFQQKLDRYLKRKRARDTVLSIEENIAHHTRRLAELAAARDSASAEANDTE